MIRKQKIFSLICLLIGVFLAVLVSELGLRFYYQIKWLQNVQKLEVVVDETGTTLLYPKSFVSFLDQDGKQTLSIPQDEVGTILPRSTRADFRILATGDSITQGVGLFKPRFASQEEREVLYVRRLRRDLKQTYQMSVDLVNTAINGFSSWEQLNVLEAVLSKTKPDLLLFQVCYNDYSDQLLTYREAMQGGKTFDKIRDGSQVRYFPWLYERSDLYKFVYDKASQLKHTGITDAKRREYIDKIQYAIKPEELEKWVEGPLTDMRNLAKENNIPYLFVVFPLRSQLVDGLTVSYPPLIDYLEEKRFRYIDLMPDYQEHYQKTGENIYQERDNVHPNAAGHEITAGVISRYINKHKSYYLKGLAE